MSSSSQQKKMENLCESSMCRQAREGLVKVHLENEVSAKTLPKEARSVLANGNLIFVLANGLFNF